MERQRRKDEYHRLKTLSRMQERAKRTEDLLQKRTGLLAQRKQIAIATKKQREVILRAMDEAKTKKNWKAASKKIAAAMSSNPLEVRPLPPLLPPSSVPTTLTPPSRVRAGAHDAGDEPRVTRQQPAAAATCAHRQVAAEPGQQQATAPQHGGVGGAGVQHVAGGAEVRGEGA